MPAFTSTKLALASAARRPSCIRYAEPSIFVPLSPRNYPPKIAIPAAALQTPVARPESRSLGLTMAYAAGSMCRRRRRGASVVPERLFPSWFRPYFAVFGDPLIGALVPAGGHEQRAANFVHPEISWKSYVNPASAICSRRRRSPRFASPGRQGSGAPLVLHPCSCRRNNGLPKIFIARGLVGFCRPFSGRPGCFGLFSPEWFPPEGGCLAGPPYRLGNRGIA